MSPLGWIVLSREHSSSREISIVGILDPEVVSAEDAIELLKSKMPETGKAFRLAVFGIMTGRFKHISKRNLAVALRKLELPVSNLSEIYESITLYVCRIAEARKLSN